MALYKEIRQYDGVTTNYHRILYINKITNCRNAIAVCSYVDSSSRDDEKNNITLEPYRQAVTYETEYNETMTVTNAYKYLKTLPEFEGAEDI